MNKFIFFIAVLLASFLAKIGFSQVDLSLAAPLDPNVRTGVLDNGFTYYVRHNQEPLGRASFYIIQNVGALLEEDDQNGLAHFLEHMAFNGTGNFEGKGVLNTLERHGVAFGRNINAYTSFSETVYNLSDVPVAPVGLIDTCLLILHDWANNLSLEEEEIDLERGVITEEWRTRRTANFRLREQWFPVVFEGSKWAERDVIGDTTVIIYHDYDTLRKFYHDWYRTDLQAIAVVGDFDVDEVEQKIIDLFSTIPPVEDAEERPIFTIPHREETAFVVATDEEATQSSINIYIVHDNNDGEEKNLEDLRNSLINSLYNQMTNQRIQELLQKGEPPFVNAGTTYGGFVRGYNAYSIRATANPGKQAEALDAIMTETERVERYGFAQSELERAKSNLLTNLESQYNEREKIRNDIFIRQYVNHYLTKGAATGIEFYYQFAQAILPTITTEEIHQKALEWIVEENRSVVITGPSDEKHLSRDEAMQIIESVKNKDIEPYLEEETASDLIDYELEGSEIVATKNLEEFDAVEWTLANGTKVVYRFADYEKDNVSLRAYSPGGHSLWDDEYVPEIDMIQQFIGAYGVGDFSAIALERMLTGKKVSILPVISDLSEGFNGSSTPRDFETLMQLTYLYFENPRFDLDAHNALMARYMAFVANMERDPQKIMQDSISAIVSNYHPRVRPLNTQLLEEIQFENFEKIYLDRFQNASDFTFFIVGNIPEQTAKEMAQKYLGSLSSSDREETWVDREVRSPQGETHKTIPLKLSTPKTQVNVRYVSQVEYNPHSILSMRILEGILRLRYTETIREDEGGTYGVGVGSVVRQYPVPEALVQMRFDTDPQRADYLKSIIYREIDKIIENGPTADDFEKTISNILKDREQSLRHNAFWMNNLVNLYVSGINMVSEDNYENLLNELTQADIQEFTTDFFENANLIDIMFVPIVEE